MQNTQITRDAQREEINILFREIGPIINLDINPNVIRGRCLCGKHVMRRNMPRHIRSLQHRTYILANPDIRETRRAWDEFVANEERRINAEVEEVINQAPIIRRRRFVNLNADEPAE